MESVLSATALLSRVSVAFEDVSSASACFFSFKATSTSEAESDGEFIELLFLSCSLRGVSVVSDSSSPDTGASRSIEPFSSDNNVSSDEKSSSTSKSSVILALARDFNLIIKKTIIRTKANKPAPNKIIMTGLSRSTTEVGVLTEN